MFWKKKPTISTPSQPKVPNAEALRLLALVLFDYFNANYDGWRVSNTNLVLLPDGRIESFTALVDQSPKIIDFQQIEQIGSYTAKAFFGIEMPKSLSLALDSEGKHQFNFGY